MFTSGSALFCSVDTQLCGNFPLETRAGVKWHFRLPANRLGFFSNPGSPANNFLDLRVGVKDLTPARRLISANVCPSHRKESPHVSVIVTGP